MSPLFFMPPLMAFRSCYKNGAVLCLDSSNNDSSMYLGLWPRNLFYTIFILLLNSFRSGAYWLTEKEWFVPDMTTALLDGGALLLPASCLRLTQTHSIKGSSTKTSQ